VHTSKPLRTSTPRSAVRPSVRAYSPACLCRCLGPVHRWDRTECRGGRSSKRPTQFQAGSQLLLVLRRSAENERRKRAACAWCVAAVCASGHPLVQTLVIRVNPLQLGGRAGIREGESREIRTSVLIKREKRRYDTANEVESCGFEGSRGPVNSGSIRPARCETVHRETGSPAYPVSSVLGCYRSDLGHRTTTITIRRRRRRRSSVGPFGFARFGVGDSCRT